MWLLVLSLLVNTLRPRQNGRHFPDDIFKCIFLNESIRISIEISLKFVPKGPINNIRALVQIMAWRRPGDKPLSESMLFCLLTHLCVTRPQWVKTAICVNTVLYIVLGKSKLVQWLVAWRHNTLPELMLSYHKRSVVALRVISRQKSLTCVWKLLMSNYQITAASPIGQRFNFAWHCLIVYLHSRVKIWIFVMRICHH